VNEISEEAIFRNLKNTDFDETAIEKYFRLQRADEKSSIDLFLCTGHRS